MGPNQYIDFESDPPGATVYVDSVEVGTTPCESNIDKGNDSEVLFVKDGYKTQKFMLTRQYDHWTSYISILLVYTFPLYFVDFATGSLSIYADEDIDVKMPKMPSDVPENLQFYEIFFNEDDIEDVKKGNNYIEYTEEDLKEELIEGLNEIGIVLHTSAYKSFTARFINMSKTRYNKMDYSYASRSKVTIEWTLEEKGEILAQGVSKGVGNWHNDGSKSMQIAILNSLYDFLSNSDLSKL